MAWAGLTTHANGFGGGGGEDPLWLREAQQRPHSARAPISAPAKYHTIIVDIESCTLGNDAAKLAELTQEVEDALRAQAAVLGDAEFEFHINRGANTVTHAVGAITQLSPRSAKHCGTCTRASWCNCPRCSRGMFGLEAFPRPGSFEVSLMLKYDRPSEARWDPPRKWMLGPVRLTSKLVSKRWPSLETIAARFGAQIRALLTMRAGATADPWPYHPNGKLQFAHVKRLPLLRGQVAELRRSTEPPQPSLTKRDADRLRPTDLAPNPSDDEKDEREVLAASAADKYVRKTDPGVRDMRTETWTWTEDEVEAESRLRRVGLTPMPEAWMTARGRPRDVYFFNQAEALSGTLQFRPRRPEDVNNVTCGIPISSPRGIVATSGALRTR